MQLSKHLASEDGSSNNYSTYPSLKGGDSLNTEHTNLSSTFNDFSHLYQNNVSNKTITTFEENTKDERGQSFNKLPMYGNEWSSHSFSSLPPLQCAYEGWPCDHSSYTEYNAMTQDMYSQELADHNYVRVDHTYRDYSCVAPTEEDRKRFLNKKKEYEKKTNKVKKDKTAANDEVNKESKEQKSRSKGKASKEEDDDIAYGFMGTNFPARLHDLLTFDEGISDIITWLPHGRAWIVLKKPEFVAKVAPSHFSISKFESFTRQVNGWGFKRITQGPDINAYYHEMFLQGMPHLIQWMKRSSSLQGRRKIRADPRDEPNFYHISSLYPLTDYYSVLCGEESPTNVCVQRDSAQFPKEYELVQQDSVEMTVVDDLQRKQIHSKKQDWKKKNLRVVTITPDLGSAVDSTDGMRNFQEEGTFRGGSPKSAHEVPTDAIFHDELGLKGDDLKDETLQDALEIWAREQTFSFTADFEVDREEETMSKMSSPQNNSNRIKFVINQPLTMTPLCDPKRNWNDDSSDLMPLPFDYDFSSSSKRSKKMTSNQVTHTASSMGPPVFYYADGHNAHPSQPDFSSDTFFHYGVYFADSKGHEVASQTDTMGSSPFMTFV